MDPKAHRDKLIADWKQVDAQAREALRVAEEARRRATFLEGAIAAMNDVIGEPAPPTDAPPAPLSRAERRRAAKAPKANGAAQPTP